MQKKERVTWCHDVRYKREFGPLSWNVAVHPMWVFFKGCVLFFSCWCAHVPRSPPCSQHGKLALLRGSCRTRAGQRHPTPHPPCALHLDCYAQGSSYWARLLSLLCQYRACWTLSVSGVCTTELGQFAVFGPAARLPSRFVLRPRRLLDFSAAAVCISNLNQLGLGDFQVTKLRVSKLLVEQATRCVGESQLGPSFL